MPIDIFAPATLDIAVKQLPPAPSFLRDKFFKRVQLEPTKKIIFDVYKGKRRVEKLTVVECYVAAQRLARLLIMQHIVATFGKRQEECQQKGHKHNPMRRGYAGGLGTGHNAQYKTGCNNHDIEQ